ncbi:unnamed protein product [Lactuca saligna]|uniref:glutathione transferase n=1 Tax=Lactuca saligna TaxID=75948 RepID=A0AA36EJ11_LACSI|nr:unnamed protein product [Lactuca saligna]
MMAKTARSKGEGGYLKDGGKERQIGETQQVKGVWLLLFDRKEERREREGSTPFSCCWRITHIRKIYVIGDPQTSSNRLPLHLHWDFTYASLESQRLKLNQELGVSDRIRSSEMADEVKLFAAGGSPFVCRVQIALNMKEIKYEKLEEDLHNKSADLLKYNPIYKKVSVLVHNGNAISESLVIVEYIDDAWKGVPILPQDPYQKVVA